MAASIIYNGKNMRLSYNGKTLYHTTNCQLTVSSETQELATKDTDGKIVSVDGYGGTLSCDALWADKPNGSTTQVDPIDLLDLQLASSLLTWEFTTGTAGDKTISGSCYVTNTDLGAEVGNKATASFQFLVSGDIVTGTVAS